jgi:abortive infection alpha-like protein
MNDDLIAISDEQAKAIQELAKATGTALETANKAGTYIAWVLGTMPRDLVGLFGDWLGHVRIRNLARLMDTTQKILQQREVAEPIPVSPTLAVPLLRAAADESQEELQEFWARLIAAAMDPATASKVRPSFIDTLRAFAPMDVRVFDWAIRKGYKEEITNPFQTAMKEIGGTQDELVVSFENLNNLRCFSIASQPIFTAFGRLLADLCRP